MLEFPGDRGSGGIGYFGECVGNVCGKCRRCVGKSCNAAIEKAKMRAELHIGCLARLCESFLKV